MKDGVDAVFGSGGTDTFKVGDLDNDGQPNLVFMKNQSQRVLWILMKA
ncbi:MAG: hypothetical protein IPJ22_05435 [Bacteroidetes bacterium]|nr:hypothetical protein [Bacteroidota bacterium]